MKLYAVTLMFASGNTSTAIAKDADGVQDILEEFGADGEVTNKEIESLERSTGSLSAGDCETTAYIQVVNIDPEVKVTVKGGCVIDVTSSFSDFEYIVEYQDNA